MQSLFPHTIDEIMKTIGKQSIILHGNSSIPLYEIAKHTIEQLQMTYLDISFRATNIYEQLMVANETPSIFGQLIVVFQDIQLLNIIDGDICKILIDICKGTGIISKHCIILSNNISYRKIKPCLKYCKIITVTSPSKQHLADYFHISPNLVIQYNYNFYRLEQLYRSMNIHGDVKFLTDSTTPPTTNMKYIYGICNDILNNENMTYEQLLGYYEQYRPLLVWMIHENYPLVRKHLSPSQLCAISLLFTMIENCELYIDEVMIRNFYLVMAGILIPLVLGKNNHNHKIQFTKLMTVKSNNART